MFFLFITASFFALVLLYRFITRTPCVFPKDGKIVITGGTSGIGLEYAKALSAQGYSLILLARSIEKLSTLDALLPTSTKGYQVDLSKPIPAEILKEIEAQAPLGLVHSAGLSYEHAEYLEDLDPQRIQDMFRVNCEAATTLTRAVLPGMKKAKKGTILLVGSGSSRASFPLYAVYSGTKAYVEAFCRSLGAETREYGITVKCVVPYYVATKMSRLRPSLTVPTAKAFVAKCLNYSSTYLHIPILWHRLIDAVLITLPDRLVDALLLKMNKSIRTRALKKKAEKDAQKKAE